jgi:hypothetical protein
MVMAEILTRCDTGGSAIDMLADNVLLEIFKFSLCRNHLRVEEDPEEEDSEEEDLEEGPSGLIWNWLFLVHVCRRWRQITFASPRRLDLQILCTYGTPVRKNLGIWPPIPIVLQYGDYVGKMSPSDEDDVIAALQHPERVSRVSLRLTESQLGKVAAVMHEPFPLLQSLSIFSKGEDELIIPCGFLGGSAPSLQKIELFGVSYPTLPTLLLSTSDIVDLNLGNIPPTGYISPEVIAAHLAMLPRLNMVHLAFPPAPSAESTQILLTPITRNVFPSLHDLLFVGDCQYLEDFVARIDTPQLNSAVIIFWDQDIIFQVPQLSQFLNRSESLKRNLSKHCRLMIDGEVHFSIGGATDDGAKRWDPEPGFSVFVRSWGIVLQIFHLSHVLSWIYPTLSDVVHFSIDSHSSVPLCERGEELDGVAWLHLFWPFSSVQTLFVSDKFAGYVSRAFAELAVLMIPNVLPALHVLCLEGQPVSSVDEFISFRRDSGHPITFFNTETEFRESYL